MCGRYGRRADKQRIAEWFHTPNTGVFDEATFAPNYNITPDSFQPVIRISHETGDRELTQMKWGLVPYRSKAPKAGFSSINAGMTSWSAAEYSESRGSDDAV
jgi:putative SOS response-associated peptidase YedK